MRLDVQGKLGGMRHQLRRGDRVYQRVNPWHQGTVVRVDARGFTVTYDRVKGDPRRRFSYPASRMGDFLVGRPSFETLANSQPPQILEA